MTVIDASVVVDALVDASEAGEAARSELRGRVALEVPAIFRAEATSALRRLVLAEHLSVGRATTALGQLRTVRTIEYPFEPFLPRVWQLRSQVTVYDAWYVALAEWLGTELVTADRRLSAVVGLRCPVRQPRQLLPD